MSETEQPHKKDTSAARTASQAAFARRRHARWMEELKAAGIEINIPDEYTGLPIEDKEKDR